MTLSLRGPQKATRIRAVPILASFIVVVFLNLCVAEGRRRFLPASPDDDFPSDIAETSDNLDPSLWQSTHFPTTPTTTVKALAPTTQKTISYEAYLEGLTNQLREDDLEYSLDYYNEKALMKEYDFEPYHLLKKLTDFAIAQGTTPAQFRQEIQDLISLQNRSRSEQDDGTSLDEVSKLPGGYLSENLLKRMTEGWKNELKRLETKYNVSAECTDSESITSLRLVLMFPHFTNFGQKPFATPMNITIGLGGQNYICDIDCRYEAADVQLPSILGRPEFAGLIPKDLIMEPVGQTIIGVHLYALHRNDQNDVIPFRTKLVMLKRRMEKSLLSNERRHRFLINNDILSKTRTLMRTSIKTAYDKIPISFTEKIDWDLLVW